MKTCCAAINGGNLYFQTDVWLKNLSSKILAGYSKQIQHEEFLVLLCLVLEAQATCNLGGISIENIDYLFIILLGIFGWEFYLGGELVDVFLGVWMICYINGTRSLLEIKKKKLGSFYPSAQPGIYG